MSVRHHSRHHIRLQNRRIRHHHVLRNRPHTTHSGNHPLWLLQPSAPSILLRGHRHSFLNGGTNRRPGVFLHARPYLLNRRHCASRTCLNNFQLINTLTSSYLSLALTSIWKKRARLRIKSKILLRHLGQNFQLLLIKNILFFR